MAAHCGAGLASATAARHRGQRERPLRSLGDPAGPQLGVGTQAWGGQLSSPPDIRAPGGDGAQHGLSMLSAGGLRERSEEKGRGCLETKPACPVRDPGPVQTVWNKTHPADSAVQVAADL